MEPGNEQQQLPGNQQQQPPGRMFLLVVGLEQTLLCMLMEQVVLDSSSQPPSVDAVYVDRGRALLLDLRAQDLLNQDTSSALPSLISADAALSSAFRRLSRPLISSVSQHSSLVPDKPRKLSDPFGIKLSKSSIDVVGSESEEEDSVVGGSGHPRSLRSRSMLHLRPSFRQRRKRTVTVSHADGPSKKNPKAPRPPHTYATIVIFVLSQDDSSFSAG